MTTFEALQFLSVGVAFYILLRWLENRRGSIYHTRYRFAPHIMIGLGIIFLLDSFIHFIN